MHRHKILEQMFTTTITYAYILDLTINVNSNINFTILTAFSNAKIIDESFGTRFTCSKNRVRLIVYAENPTHTNA